MARSATATPRVLVFEAQYAQLVDALRARLAGHRAYVCIGGTRAGLGARLRGGGRARVRPRARRSARSRRTTAPWSTPAAPPAVPRARCAAQWRWVRTAEGGAYTSEFNSDTRVLLATPAFHVGVIGYALQVRWHAGTLVLQRGFDAAQRDPQAIAAGAHHASPSSSRRCCRRCSIRRRSAMPTCRSLRNVVAAAAPVPVPLLQRAFARLGPIFSVQYGATETAGTADVRARAEAVSATSAT